MRFSWTNTILAYINIQQVISGVSGAKRKGTVDTEFEKEMSLNQMIAEEKQTTAEQQIAMFGRTVKV